MPFPTNVWGSSGFPFTGNGFPVKRNKIADAIILALFSNNERGGYYKLTPDNLYTTSAGDTQAVVGDPVGRVDSQTGVQHNYLGDNIFTDGSIEPQWQNTTTYTGAFDSGLRLISRISSGSISVNDNTLIASGSNGFSVVIPVDGIYEIEIDYQNASSGIDIRQGVQTVSIPSGNGTIKTAQRYQSTLTAAPYIRFASEGSITINSISVRLVEQIGVTTTSPISAERPILRETPDGVRYLEFLSTSRVTFDFGQPFKGAMWVSTLGGSYVVEIDTDSTFVWGQYMPVREVTGIVFVEGYDIESNQAETVRATLATVTGGQLDWEDGRGFTQAWRENRVSRIRGDLFASINNVGSSTNGFALAFSGCNFRTFPANVFDLQTVTSNYISLARSSSTAINPQGIENILVSILHSVFLSGVPDTTNVNKLLGIRGDGSPLTPAAENARQQLLARGWDLTLDNIAGL